MNPDNHSLIKAKQVQYDVADARVDPIDEGMNAVEDRLATDLWDDGFGVEKVALRILNETFVVAFRMTNLQTITLTFDAKYIPGILLKEHYELIKAGFKDAYNERKLKK